MSHVASCGLVHIHRGHGRALRLTVGPVTVTLSQAALEQLSEASQAALIALTLEQAQPGRRHLSVVEPRS